MVGERSNSGEGETVSDPGAVGSDDLDISNDKAG